MEGFLREVADFHPLKKEWLVCGQRKFYQPFQVDFLSAVKSRNHIQRADFWLFAMVMAERTELYGWMPGYAAKTQVESGIFQARSGKLPAFEKKSARVRVEDKVKPGISQSCHMEDHLS